MQRQLAALRSSAEFLAPSSWPDCNVLTSCRVASVLDDLPLYMESASRAQSLVSLDVLAGNVSSFSSLAHLSNLQSLTQMKLCTEGPGGDVPFEPVLEATGQLSKLQHLTLDDSVFGSTPASVGVAIPESWSALQALQHFALTYGTVSMPTLYHLTCLTSLEGKSTAGGADVPLAGGLGAEAPQQWRDGLRRLTWGNCGRSSLPFLSQLTSVTCLHLGRVCVSPELVRRAASRLTPVDSNAASKSFRNQPVVTCFAANNASFEGLLICVAIHPQLSDLHNRGRDRLAWPHILPFGPRPIPRPGPHTSACVCLRRRQAPLSGGWLHLHVCTGFRSAGSRT
jgi:hypothetical protein